MLDPISGPGRSTVIGSGLETNPTASAEPTVDFGSFLAQMAADTAHTLKAGEATAVAGINGQASANEVVQAVMTTEQTLQSAIVIRDKVVSAFLELSRMQI